MKKILNLISIILIFVVPIGLYYVLNPAGSDNSVLASNSKPVVIDFSSPMCLECKELEKVLTPTKKKYCNKITFKKVLVNSTDSTTQGLVKKYDVNVVPTLVFIDKNGKLKKKTEGSMSQKELEGYLNNLINE